MGWKPGSISQRRKSLGSEPFKLLFERLKDFYDELPGTCTAFNIVSVDGSKLCFPKGFSNAYHQNKKVAQDYYLECFTTLKATFQIYC